jgi:hypothetical protein
MTPLRERTVCLGRAKAVAVVLVLAALACARTERRPDAAADTLPRRSEPSGPASTSSPPLHLLLDSLKRVPAAFVKDQAYGIWEFHGDTTLFGAIASFGDTAIVELISALDDSVPARATANGVPVPAGVMYGVALSRMAYYEWNCETDTTQILCGGWIKPDATPSQLIAAKLAWRQAFTKGILIRTR